MRWSCVFILCSFLNAQTSGTIRGVVHDPQHRPLESATVTLESKIVKTDSNGEFTIDGLPQGPAILHVNAPGFAPLEQQVTVAGDKTPVLHFQLKLAEVKQSVEVAGAMSRLNAQTSTVAT